MLTGDKTLTAVNIAKASGLTSKQSAVLEFTKDKLEEELDHVTVSHDSISSYTDEETDHEAARRLTLQ